MTKRTSFAGRVKAASKRAAATANGKQHTTESPATARLREREIAAGAPTSNLQPPTSTTKRRRPPTGASRLPTPASHVPQAEPSPGYVAVGRVLGPFGLKGEMKVLPLTDNPARFAPKAKLFAGLQPVTVLRSREASGHLYLTFKGFPGRDAVDKFRHALLQVPESDLPPLPEGDYYRFQLFGLTVVDRTGAVLGTLDEIIETGSNDVYRVHPPEGADVLLPALADVVVSVDLVARRMVVDPPEWR